MLNQGDMAVFNQHRVWGVLNVGVVCNSRAIYGLPLSQSSYWASQVSAVRLTVLVGALLAPLLGHACKLLACLNSMSR